MQDNVEKTKTALDNFVITQSVIFEGINNTRKNLHKMVISMAEREQEADLKQFLRRETMIVAPSFKAKMQNTSTATKRDLDRILGLNKDGIGIGDNPDDSVYSNSVTKTNNSKDEKFYSVAGMSDIDKTTPMIYDPKTRESIKIKKENNLGSLLGHLDS